MDNHTLNQAFALKRQKEELEKEIRELETIAQQVTQTTVTLLFFVFTLLLHCFYTVVTLLLHYWDMK
jgi:hypothetical protein